MSDIQEEGVIREERAEKSLVEENGSKPPEEQDISIPVEKAEKSDSEHHSSHSEGEPENFQKNDGGHYSELEESAENLS